MSGPKRADVQSALDQAARTAQTVAETIGKAQDGTIRALADQLAEEAQKARGLEDQLGALEKELAATGSPEARRALLTAKAARERIRDVASRRTDLGKQVSEIAKLAGEAGAAHARAQKQYDAARASLSGSGGHYLSQEMASATAAGRAFDDAAAVAQRAAAAREHARVQATAALEVSHAALAAGQQALGQADKARRAVEERRKAAEEAQRIVEQARRAAVEALQEATIAVDALDGAVVDQFLPDRRARLAQSVEEAGRALAAGRFADVHSGVKAIASETGKVAEEAAEAKRRHDEGLARASAAASELAAVIGGADEEVLREWAADSAALTAARTAAAAVDAAIAAGDFDRAVALAGQAGTALDAAVADAAETLAQDVRRAEIGDAVMDVLEELGFETSCEDGTRDQALKISGQTSSETGRGDFEIEIPLDGEVDFEVKADEGDTACATVIRDLQKKLAARGIDWKVTDWGHATGTETGGRTRTQTQTQTQTRTQTPG
ncbi:hypothetical protein [Nocardioides sp. W7]|uniref:hypothetical protein n=1 Tax=Nocardioides sp. W7 TaxID=2931390 RepID=UPI001FD1EF79|nr:hypothetical protein [Nocardioides sp. W7]